MTEQWDTLRNGVVLAELGGLGDGPYCAVHGKGAALVTMGTYIVDPGDSIPYDAAFVFRTDQPCYQDYLRRHVAAAKECGAKVGVSVVSVDLTHTIEFLQSAEEAGADYLSLCLHSDMEMFVSAGMSSALLREENWPRLREHLSRCLAALGRPFIAKIGCAGLPKAESAVAEITAAGVRLIHANVGAAATAQGRDTIRRLRSHSEFLIAGGGVTSVEEARAALEAGADAVAIGTAAMHDPAFCGRLQASLR
jgi:tRNA-dihydrouridine synthase